LSTPDESQFRVLIQQAERAQAAGQRDEAQRLLARAESAAPDHPLVLNARAIDLLQTGNAARARELLERAVAIEAANPALWMNIATACRALGKLDDEEKALERLLELEPRHLLGLLQKAELLTRRGKPKAAAGVYHNALQTLQPDQRLPAVLRDALQRAFDAVRRNDAALAEYIGEAARAVRAAHAPGELSRVEHALGALTGSKRIYLPRPTFLHVPKLATEEFYPREKFSWLAEFEAATAEIRAEFERALAEDSAGAVPYIDYPDGTPLDQWAELNKSRRWSAFFLWRDGQRVDAHADRCPRTASLLAKAPTADVRGYAPTAFFSILDKKSHIPPHCGVTNSRLIIHLPLVVPGNCRFRVGSETREWEVGKAWVFDDTIEHEAWNDSDLPRAILIFDTWHPDLSAAERELLRTAVPAIKDYYRDEVAITGSEQ
jgi:aspartyl/asparaginyl beta-hydroxylase (cupin superfamily)